MKQSLKKRKHMEKIFSVILSTEKDDMVEFKYSGAYYKFKRER
jgi:hypothetical protein